MSCPSEGITTQVEIINVTDGDTVEVEIRRRFKVRLTHPSDKKTYIFDTPENSTVFGRRVTSWVRSKLAHFNGKVRLFIPSGQPIDLMDTSSFRRILGEIWLDNERLSDILLKKGYARIISRRKRTSTAWEEDNVKLDER